MRASELCKVFTIALFTEKQLRSNELPDAVDQGNFKPTFQQKRQILARIQVLPGCEEYKMANLEQWFRIRREKHEKTDQANDLEGQAISPPYPSIPPKKMQALETMYQTHPYPSQEMIFAWATLTEAPLEDIEKWVKDKQAALSRPHDAVHQPVPRPPPMIQKNVATHASSNAPSPAIQSSLKSEVSSPVIHSASASVPSHSFHPSAGRPAMSPSDYYPSPCDSTTSMSPNLRPASFPHNYGHFAENGPAMPSGRVYPPLRSSETATPRMCTPPPEVAVTRREELLFAIHSAFGMNDKPMDKLPGTAQEFHEQFSLYEEIFGDFLTKVESGELASWGLRRDMVPM
ncbi:hypothetical protein D9758_002482 [Tetrapyrgos nigripes]|uniref:Homeobox domain-containing protein n=1 Tax=Tetrapyrgos nigripes TaxID=182062 RepID=A0A8H5LU76_9AGAR|nr:hypothetical protein D9758_002482 [Tetrapyrgos nigripes]